MSHTKKHTTIINLYGGPGTGKSTSAAQYYHQLKVDGHNVELVREYVKDWAWEERRINTYDQIYFLGKQVRRESMLYGKVDWIVTDSPVMMNLYYAQRYCTLSLAEGVRAATLSFYRQAAEDGHQHIHIFLERTKPYLSEGRYQTEHEAKEIDFGIKQLLKDLKIPVFECPAEKEDLAELLNKLVGNVKKSA
jgi:hypothetical protein